MIQEKKQTAVEWLMHELRWEGFIEDGDDLIVIEHKALAMEREQHQKTFLKGFARTVSGSDFLTFKEYFTETYGKEADNE